MGKCETCGNDYLNSFTVEMDEVVHTYDSFECAIHALAPRCAHCNCTIIGHGVEAAGVFYCCAHCANASGVTDVQDHSAAGTQEKL